MIPASGDQNNMFTGKRRATSGFHCMLLLPAALIINLVRFSDISSDNYLRNALMVIFLVPLSLIHFFQDLQLNQPEHSDSSPVTDNDCDSKRPPPRKVSSYWLVITCTSVCYSAIGAAIGLPVQQKWANIIFGILTSCVFIKLHRFLRESFPDGFTCGERLVATQAGSVMISGCSFTAVCSLVYGDRCSPYVESDVLQILLLGILLMSIQIQWKDQLGVRDKYLIIASAIAVSYLFLSARLSTNPVAWLVLFLFKSTYRTHLMICWAVISLLTALFLTWFTRRRIKANTTVRKFFHIIMDVVFAFGLFIDLEMMYFSFASLFIIMLLLELVRILKLPPFFQTIEDCFRSFRDEKDSETLTLTHIYLLVGCSLPLWLHPDMQQAPKLLLSSGIITIGFGDTAAAVFGSYFGRKKWSNSHKTMEGSACAVVAQLLGSWILTAGVVGGGMTVYQWAVVLAAALVVAAIEGKTSQVDNLILPFYHYMIVASFI